MLRQAGGEGLGAPMVDLESGLGELGCETAHRGEHQVQTLPVPPLRGDLRLGLDEQDTGVGRVTVAQGGDAPVELIPQDPHRVHGRRVSHGAADDVGSEPT